MSKLATQRFRLDPLHPPQASAEELAALDARSDAELIAAAKADPDNPPLDEAMLARMLPVVDVCRLRRRLGLSQRAFARRYRLAIGTVRDWEQGRTVPDQPARVLLSLIERDAAAVAQTLDELLAGITPENLPESFDDASVGEEAL